MSYTPRTDAEANGGNSMGVLMGNGLRYALVQSEFARQLERELNAANERIKRLEEESESRWNLAQSAIGSCAEMSSRIKQLEEALSLFIVDCDNLHHSKKHQHGFHDPCPVVDLILDAKEIKP